jgi:hypothetical protein
MIDGDDLPMTIPYCLAQKIDVRTGSGVYVNHRSCKLNITRGRLIRP